MRRTARVVAVLVMAAGLQVPTLAFTLDYDFEDLADLEALTNQYSGDGVHFGGGAVALQEGGSLNTAAGWYATSPVTVISTPGGSDYIEVLFDMPVSGVSAMYECRYSDFYLDAYDEDGGDPIASDSGAETYVEGWGHIAAAVAVSDAEGLIRSVRFHNGGSFFLIDDLHIEGTDAGPGDETPEPCTWVLLACTGIAGAVARRRRST